MVWVIYYVWSLSIISVSFYYVLSMHNKVTEVFSVVSIGPLHQRNIF